MRKIVLYSIYFLIPLFILSCVHEDASIPYKTNKGFTSWLPAPKAPDAMLIGNGTMGAMVYGHPHEELIIVNHHALYLPTGIPKKPIHMKSILPEIKKLIKEGKGTEAAQLPIDLSYKEGYEGQQWSDPYIPAFDIKIYTTPADIESYQRNLNFETGEASVCWKQNGSSFKRRQFISRADSVLVIEITADKPFSSDFIIDRRSVAWNEWDYINNNFKSTAFYAQEDKLFYKSEFKNQWAGNIAGFEGQGKIITDGEISAAGNKLAVSNTDRVMLLVDITTYKTGETPESDKLAEKLENISTSYDQLLENHKKIHTELFNRVSLKLNPKDQSSGCDAEVMMLEAKKDFTASFVEKQFYAARYNILSATGKTPPNLQGIWGPYWQPPWSADYTHDGNLPVAISSFLMSDMPELMMSFFDYHDSHLPYYRDNAKNLYGCRGIHVPSHSSSTGWNVHFDPVWCLLFWNGGAAWASHFYYDYWLYTKDTTFLKERALPFMEETALFYEDFLEEGDNGKYVFNPSYSPENNPANNPSQATMNATMDVMLAKELFRNLIVAAKELNEPENKILKWQEMLSKLPAYEVDSAGALREWLWPGYEENHHHRHISHLYGMYDMIDPEIAADSILIKGVHKAVEERMKIRRKDGGGIMVFGMVQMAWVAANLGDAELVQDILSWLSAQYWSNSLATYHDPNGLFNMDLSGGFQTAVIRALVYSEPGLISILPAKPPLWIDGELQGVKARNLITIESLKWDEEKTEATLLSEIDQETEIRLPAFASDIELNNEANLLSYDKDTRSAKILLPAKTLINLKINNYNEAN